MADVRYDHKEIESRWQRLWADEHTWEVSNEPGGRERAYVLEMLPYPSGEPHIGHLKNYSVGDVVAHFQRRKGLRVLHPMGYDAFGLPAENHAISTGQHPRESTEAAISSFRASCARGGSRSTGRASSGPTSRATTAGRSGSSCSSSSTASPIATRPRSTGAPTTRPCSPTSRSSTAAASAAAHEVELRQLEQWFFRITDYADRLLDDLDTIEWPENVKRMQRNWIGRSEGAEVTFSCEDPPIDYPVFTTRPDTLFGATFFVMAPEHPDVFRLAEGTGHEQAVHAYVNHALNETSEERGDAERDKTGVFLGRYVINPVNGERLPMYVADYVLMEYGTGAIMAVPGHDHRDHDFATQFGLPIREVVAGGDDVQAEAYTGDGPLVNSHPEFDGLPNREALERIVAWLDREGKGHASVNYRLRDWLLSRQRYWGCPIPVVHCERCGIVPVPEDELPVLLPDIDDYAPKGRSPLAAAEDWVNTPCPSCGGPARRETDTMDTFVDSSWYFMRYVDAGNDEAAWDPAILAEWMPVDQYIGGVEHAILHLMYARFFTKALADLGHVGFQEPFARLFTQGMITRDGTKMSKSRGNVVSPQAIIDRYGADTARCYILFIGPPDQDADWSDKGVEGVHRFLGRLWRLAATVAEDTPDHPIPDEVSEADLELLRKAHWAIEKVTNDISGRFAFNTAIAAIMELTNTVSKHREAQAASPGALRFALATVLVSSMIAAIAVLKAKCTEMSFVTFSDRPMCLAQQPEIGLGHSRRVSGGQAWIRRRWPPDATAPAQEAIKAPPQHPCRTSSASWSGGPMNRM